MAVIGLVICKQKSKFTLSIDKSQTTMLGCSAKFAGQEKLFLLEPNSC